MKSLEAAYSWRITASCLAFDLWNGTAINHQRMRAILAVDALRMAIDVLAAHVRTMFFLNSSAPTCILVGMVEAEKDLRRDEGFRRRLAKVFSDWYDGIAAALREGQKRGLVRSGVDPNETMANSKLNTNEASVAQLQTGRFEHGPL